MDHVLEIYALFMLLGCFTTIFIPETARKTLEELSGEDDYAAHHHDEEVSHGPGVDSEVITKISADGDAPRSPSAQA
jgi:PHS family inorganic phosphate transporter-like MFS transporter